MTGVGAEIRCCFPSEWESLASKDERGEPSAHERHRESRQLSVATAMDSEDGPAEPPGGLASEGSTERSMLSCRQLLPRLPSPRASVSHSSPTLKRRENRTQDHNENKRTRNHPPKMDFPGQTKKTGQFDRASPFWLQQMTPFPKC